MHLSLGRTASPALVSPITKKWSDMWVIDELVIVGWVWARERGERGAGGV